MTQTKTNNAHSKSGIKKILLKLLSWNSRTVDNIEDITVFWLHTALQDFLFL